MDPLEHAKRLFFEALSCQEKGDLRAAERLYEEALALAPDRPSIMSNLAVVYIKMGKYLEARHLCERSVARDPHDRHALVHLGISLAKLNAADQALEAFDAVLAVQPDDPHALANRAGALMQLQRLDEAIVLCQRALSIQPEFPDAMNILGDVLVQSGRTEEALSSYERALELRPHHGETLFNIASTLLRLRRSDEGNEIFRRAVELCPNDAQRRVNFACVQLEQGNFQHGWSNYESRFQSEEHRRTGFRRDLQSVLRFEELQRWKGPTQSGIGSVAIWAEQGIGDEILFSTLIPDLIYSGTWFVYEIDARLIAAYRRAFPNASFVERSDPPAAELQNGDYVLAAGSLPRLFRTSCRDFERQPRALVQALPERVAHYRQELAALGRGLKVALSWHSARGHWWARRKNVALGSLTPLLQVAGAHFVDVQYGDTADERARVEAAAGVSIKRFDSVDHFHDLEDVMAILEACDLVITTSNVTAHLAGVIGKRTWVLFPGHRPPFHYWAHRGDHRSPWYPSVEIVSAPEPGDWTSVVRGVAQKLSRSI